MPRPTRWAFLLIATLLLVTRLCHLDIVWVEEGYPMAAAQQMLMGKALYRDVWFDKPPLSAAFYLLWGAWPGWPLRVADALFVLIASFIAYRFGRDAWGEREGVTAAALLAISLTFGIPAAVMALAPDLLMIVPHLAAVWCAWRGRPLLAGMLAAIAMLVNAKAVYVLAACALWQWRSLPMLGAGFVLPLLIHAAYLQTIGALQDYWQQVWAWGFLYSSHSFVEHPWREAVVRTGRWMGFQAALVVGVGAVAWHTRARDEWRWYGWLLLSLIGVCAGWRFFPRYYFQLLPPAVLLASRGLWMLPKRLTVAALLLLLIPVVRFGPRYAVLATDLMQGRPHHWADLSMAQDSEKAAEYLVSHGHAGDSLLVWGYRPDLLATTRMPLGTRYLDSQPLTGVLADRHLFASDMLTPDLARTNRQLLIQTSPTWIVDGLGLYNSTLAISTYPDLKPWLSNYVEVSRTSQSILYRRR